MEINYNDHKFIEGTCEFLCPSSEVELRKRNNLVHHFETVTKTFVKEFSRSAADRPNQKPENLRTFDAMLKTVDFLFTRIIVDPTRDYNFRYDFCFDRCRALRQELVIQNISPEKSLKILEPTVMFLSFSVFHLQTAPISSFDPVICRQHLKECLQTCLGFYDKIDKISCGKINYKLDNRIIVETIYLMLHMDEGSCLQRVLNLNSRLRSSYIMQIAIQISINMQIRNYSKVIRLIPNLPHLPCAIASLKMKVIRKQILGSFCVAYHSNTLRVPADFLTRLLKYNRDEDLRKDLTNLGIICESESQSSVNFNRRKFNIDKTCFDFSCEFVQSKIKDCHIPDLILLKTL